MKRLPNDCFSNIEDMLAVDEARAEITKNILQITDTEIVNLEDASGRILAEDMYALFPVPPADNSAVDGYAFWHADYENQNDRKFEVAGRSAAGKPYSGSLTEGQCVKIFTGAPMPDRCDSIAMIEDISEFDGKVEMPRGLTQSVNRRFAGEDIKAGSLVLNKGTSLRPQEIGHLACIGKLEIPVFKKIRIALLSTGDELENPGDALPFGSIYDSNRYMLSALLRKYGCIVKDFGIVPDTYGTLRDTLVKAAKESDLVITSGGVSMGDEDHVKSAIEATGSLHFWRIAIKPGRPLALGQIKGTAFVGLPGNPVAAMVCAMQFVRPIIARLSGDQLYTPPIPMFGAANFSMKKKTGRREWLRGRYSLDENGAGKIEKYHSTGSGLISSLVWSNGLIELDEKTSIIDEGDKLRFLPYSELFE